MTAEDRVGFREGAVALFSVAVLALLVPLVILALGAPVALGARAVAELFTWLAALIW